jgi:hypothetical protein
MFEILVPRRVQAETNKRYGEIFSPCLPAPILETPHALPQSIEVCRIKTKDEPWKLDTTGTKDQRLTELLTTYTDGIFNLDVEDVRFNDGSVAPLINTFNCASQFAIGPRLELLEKYHGIGSALINLLKVSPAWIMTPDYIDEYLVDMYEYLGRTGDNDRKRRSTGLLPDFAHGTDTFAGVPKGLPYNLSKLIEDCLSRSLDCDFISQFERLDVELSSWPIATCSWYGFEPMLDKTMEKFACSQDYDAGYRLSLLRDCPDMGQASDPTWMVLDDLIIHEQEYSHSSCISPCHTATEIEDTLYSIGPFARLLKYLSHDRIN